MKKVLVFIIIILICILILFIGKFNYKDKKINKEETNIEENIEENKQDNDIYVDNNPIILGLYKNYHNNKERELIKEYSSKWEYHQDISSFEVYYTNEKLISSGNQIKLFDEYKDKYENALNYKIGYYISFTTTKGIVKKTILSPKDTTEFFNYLEIYLYDDYHRSGGWYSHTTEEEFNDNTLLTSIKLTAGVDILDITSDITLKVFSYDSDDFSIDGEYIGKSIYTITVKKV